jgi:chromate transporter
MPLPLARPHRGQYSSVATFIGYKLAGFTGALLATAAIFSPSVFLTIMVSKIFNRHQANKTVKNVLAGIKTVVVALIIVSAYRVTANQHIDALFIAVVAACFILNYKYKVSPVYLILGAVLTGTINHIL